MTREHPPLRGPFSRIIVNSQSVSPRCHPSSPANVANVPDILPSSTGDSFVIRSSDSGCRLRGYLLFQKLASWMSAQRNDV